MSALDSEDEVILDGLSGEELFSNRNGYTYSDYIILPGSISFDACDVSVQTHATKKISINTPFISSPMDTVTEHQMAIHMALFGGLGIIHCNNTIEEQCDEVMRVKRYENGFILDPFTVGPEATLSQLDEIKRNFGFSGCPVTETGKLGGRLIGIVTTRDHDFIKDRTVKVKEVMTTELTVAKEGCSLEEANQILRDSKRGKLPVVNENYELVAAISRKDLRKNRDFPLASKDVHKRFMIAPHACAQTLTFTRVPSDYRPMPKAWANTPRHAHRLLVGAAIHTRPNDRIRVAKLVEAGADIIVIDSSQACACTAW